MKYIIYFFSLLIISNSVKAQDDNYVDQYKLYYSLDEALKNPEKVYKLILRDNLDAFPYEISSFPNLTYLKINVNIDSFPDSVKYPPESHSG